MQYESVILKHTTDGKNSVFFEELILKDLVY